MIWIIASVPFWLLGLFFVAAGACAVPLRKPDETVNELLAQVGVCWASGFTFLLVAAKIAS